MCQLCRKELNNNINQIKSIKCKKLKTIYFSKTVNDIVCQEAKQLNEIKIEPDINYNDQSLQLYDCPKLNIIPIIPRLKHLIITNCPVENIPIIPGLETLQCTGTLITEIPLIKSLTSLICINNQFLEFIPTIKNLITLVCMMCPNLAAISSSCEELSMLSEFVCQECPLITIFPKGSLVHTFKCTICFDVMIGKRIKQPPGHKYHINTDNNLEYKERINKLILLQRWIKKVIVRQRIKKLIPHLVKIYYTSD